MRNKILAIIACIILVFALSIPCFADGWEWWTYNERMNPTKTDLSSALFQGFYTENTQDTFIELLNTAKDLNAFNGMLPVFCTMTISPVMGTDQQYGLSVWAISPEELTTATPLTNTWVQMQTTTTSPYQNYLLCEVYESENSNIPMTLYEYGITSNGSFVKTGNTKDTLYIPPYIASNLNALRLVCVWGGQNTELTRYNGIVTSMDQYYTAYYAGTQYRDKTWALAETWKNRWVSLQENVTEEPPVSTPPQVSYTLSIPELITSIPAAAQNLIITTFGFEIFGINVAGLLSVILIVVIVSFAIEWLMNR